MCYLANQRINYNLQIDLIDVQALGVAIYITSFYMCLLVAHVKSLQSIQLTLYRIMEGNILHAGLCN